MHYGSPFTSLIIPTIAQLSLLDVEPILVHSCEIHFPIRPVLVETSHANFIWTSFGRNDSSYFTLTSCGRIQRRQDSLMKMKIQSPGTLQLPDHKAHFHVAISHLRPKAHPHLSATYSLRPTFIYQAPTPPPPPRSTTI